MRGYIFLFLVICSNVAHSYAEGLPANPWAKSAVQVADNPAVSVVNEHPSAIENRNISEQGNANLNPYLINIQENLDKADIQNRITDALQSLESINENPTTKPSATPSSGSLPSWREFLPQADLSAFTAQSTTKPKKQKSASGNDEFSKAISDIEKQYKDIKRTTNSYYRSAVKNVRDVEQNAKDSVNKLQKMLK